MPSDLEEVGLGPTGSWAFYRFFLSLSVSLSHVSLNRILDESSTAYVSFKRCLAKQLKVNQAEYAQK